MKKIILTALLGALTLSLAIAQNRPQKRVLNHPQGSINYTLRYANENILNPEEIAKRQTENMKTRLGLTSEQEKKVYELNLKTAKEQAKIRESIRIQREQLAKNIIAKDSLVNNVLTAEQKRFHELYKHMSKQRVSKYNVNNTPRNQIINGRKANAQGMGMRNNLQHHEL